MADGAMRQGANGPEPQDAGKEYVLQGFAQIADVMKKQAAVLQTDAPQLMPIFIKAVTALKMVEQEFSKQSQGQGQPASGSEPPQQQGAEGPMTLGA